MGYKKPEVRSYSAGDILEELGPCQNQYTFYTSPGNYIGNANDGYIDSTGYYIIHEELWVGDKATSPDIGLRSVVGFDISSISGRTVVSATLRVYQNSVFGDPYGGALGSLVVDHVDIGDLISASDYSGGTLASNIGTISTNATLEWKTLDVTSYVQADLNAGRTWSQYRLQFENEQNNNGEDDFASFESAENLFGTQTPQLVVTYG